MDLGLQNKVALVTGAARGIGEAIVRTFLAEQASVAAVVRHLSQVTKLKSDLSFAEDRIHFVEAELGDFDACRRAVEQATSCFGRLDIIVNNAGANDSIGLDATPDDFEASIRRNVTHYFALVHHAKSQLVSHRGSIVNVGSKVSHTGQGGTSGYAAAKGAINALTREWAVDLAPFGVRVNAVIPAEVWTPMYEKWLKSLSNGDRTKAQIEKLIPLEHRFTTCDEIAKMVVFLSSTCSSHTTGQIIFVDGGYTHFDRKVTAPFS
jgi:NAD(P)-dependent dehydrogenase (short-subunit alcohol dehydrogenase family)